MQKQKLKQTACLVLSSPLLREEKKNGSASWSVHGVCALHQRKGGAAGGGLRTVVGGGESAAGERRVLLARPAPGGGRAVVSADARPLITLI